MGIETANYAVRYDRGAEAQCREWLRSRNAIAVDAHSPYENSVIADERIWADIQLAPASAFDAPYVNVRVALCNPDGAEVVLVALLQDLERRSV